MKKIENIQIFINQLYERVQPTYFRWNPADNLCQSDISEIYNKIIGYCFHCGEKLKKIGYDRRNGRRHPDWKSRKFHKKCWLNLKIIQQNPHQA